MGNHHTSRVLNTLRAGSLPANQPLCKSTDFQAVSQWTRKDYRPTEARGNAQQGEMDGNATTARSKGKRGRPHKGSDVETSKTHLYLENADGTLVDSDQIADMSRKARILWRTLNKDGLAPPTFGQMMPKAFEYFLRMMLADEAHDFLLLCDDGEWKLREWSTRSYPSWHRNRFGQSEAEKDGEGNGKTGKFFFD